MSVRSLSHIEQDFLASLQQCFLETPEPIDLANGRAKALIALIMSATRSSSTVEATIGPVCQTTELANWLGISRQAVHKGVRERRILGFQIGRAWHYPTWQLGPDQVLPEATQLFKSLYGPAPTNEQRVTAARWAWQRSPITSVLAGMSPALWLQTGGDYETLAAYMTERTIAPQRGNPRKYVTELAS